MQSGHEPTSYKKKSTKKKPKKSDHKHEYQRVIAVDKNFNLPFDAEKCCICGKINVRYMYFFEKTDRNFHRLLSCEEVKEKYPELEEVEIDL